MSDELKFILCQILSILNRQANLGGPMSEELKFTLCQILSILDRQAKQTKNPIDDTIVAGLKAMIGCPDKPKTQRTKEPSMN